jgi:hypothetical protein
MVEKLTQRSTILLSYHAFGGCQEPVVTRILRDQKIPVISFVANTGGLLGLCMGFRYFMVSVTFSVFSGLYELQAVILYFRLHE